MLAGMFIREKTLFLPIATFTGAALNLGLNFIFIPFWGVIGAAYSTVIAYLVMVLIMYGISYNIYRVNYEFKRLGIVFLLTAIPIALTLVVQPEVNSINILCKFALFMMPPIVYYSSNFLLPEERYYIIQFLNFHHKKRGNYGRHAR